MSAAELTCPCGFKVRIEAGADSAGLARNLAEQQFGEHAVACGRFKHAMSPLVVVRHPKVLDSEALVRALEQRDILFQGGTHVDGPFYDVLSAVLEALVPPGPTPPERVAAPAPRDLSTRVGLWGELPHVRLSEPDVLVVTERPGGYAFWNHAQIFKSRYVLSRGEEGFREAHREVFGALEKSLVFGKPLKETQAGVVHRQTAGLLWVAQRATVRASQWAIGVVRAPFLITDEAENVGILTLEAMLYIRPEAPLE